MKKTLISVAAASLMMGTVASADVDFDVSGQAVVYYETNEGEASTAADMFDKDASVANVGIQLNANADLGNGFGFGSQVSILDTWGLENNLVSNVAQNDNGEFPTTDPAFTKLYLTKKIGNTTLKGGRQELPKSLSPMAFSEGWNVFKNTFDAILAINSDLPDTTLVGAYVSTSNQSDGQYDPTSILNFNGALDNFTTIGASGAYMLTAQNKSVPMTTITASYYSLPNTGIDVIWGDVKVAGSDLPAGLNFGLQAASIGFEGATNKDTAMFGAKVGAKVDMFSGMVAYSSVDEGTASVKNVGTGVKTALYTQMVGNQNFICTDASTVVVKAGANFGDAGKLSIAYGMTSDDNTGGTAATQNDYDELDVIYKIKAGGVQYFAAYVMQDQEKALADNDKVRFWARYAF